MHPGGRFVLLEGPEPDGERGNRNVILSIADLQERIERDGERFPNDL